MTSRNANFSNNLRTLCAQCGSIAQVCRDIGLNRQQFNRYVTGAGLPSAHNLYRIAAYFGVPESDLFRDSTEFLSNQRWQSGDLVPKPLQIYANTFQQQDALLRRYLGFYHSHFVTPSWSGYIYRSLIRLWKQDGFVMSKTIERVSLPDRTIRQRVVYGGLAALQGHQIYMVEVEQNMEGSIAHTVLFPTHRHEVRYLRGQTAGVAWRPQTQPYASRVIWKRLPEKISAREAISQCGIYRSDSREIDPTVRNFLFPKDESLEPQWY